jgi:lipoprotein-anchoring transpeptidase ErfK/SrfK
MGLRRILAVLAALVLVLDAGAVAAVAYDRSTRDELLPGVRVGGVVVGGMEVDAAARLVEAHLSPRRDLSLDVEAGSLEATYTLEDLGLHTDAAEAVEAARSDAHSFGLVARVWRRLLDRPVARDYPVRLRVERGRVRSAVSDLAREFDRPAVDARIDTSSGFVRVVPARAGRALDVSRATALVADRAEALANGAADEPEVALPVAARQPDVNGFADVILVRVGENRLYHYEDGKLAKAYAVATGQPKYPTPTGRFQIVQKRRNPTWVNPDPKGWGKDLPAKIGPGRSNPLGTRALNLSVGGIRIHGTSAVGSLGTFASHGCIRMAMTDVEELFERVSVGTPVIVIRAGEPKRPAPVQPMPTIGDPNAPVDLEAG